MLRASASADAARAAWAAQCVSVGDTAAAAESERRSAVSVAIYSGVGAGRDAVVGDTGWPGAELVHDYEWFVPERGQQIGGVPGGDGGVARNLVIVVCSPAHVCHQGHCG